MSPSRPCRYEEIGGCRGKFENVINAREKLDAKCVSSQGRLMWRKLKALIGRFRMGWDCWSRWLLWPRAMGAILWLGCDGAIPISRHHLSRMAASLRIAPLLDSNITFMTYDTHPLYALSDRRNVW